MGTRGLRGFHCDLFFSHGGGPLFWAALDWGFYFNQHRCFEACNALRYIACLQNILPVFFIVHSELFSLFKSIAIRHNIYIYIYCIYLYTFQTLYVHFPFFGRGFLPPCPLAETRRGGHRMPRLLSAAGSRNWDAIHPVQQHLRLRLGKWESWNDERWENHPCWQFLLY